jgi:uncharacterized protein
MSLPIIAAVRFFCIAVGALVIVRLVGRSLLLTILGVGRGEGPPEFWRDRVLLRYEKMRTSVWMFAWFKIRLDPMFGELPRLLEELPPPGTILDVGCGYGVAGCAMLEWFPEAAILGIDPSAARVRAASSAFGARGVAVQGRAPDFITPLFPEKIDAAMLLDVIHFLTDEQVGQTLTQIRSRVSDGGALLVRVAIPEKDGGSVSGRVERFCRVFVGGFACYRSAAKLEQLIADGGFDILRNQPSGTGGELHWFVAKARPRG